MNAFREIFEQWLLLVGGVGLALTLTAWVLCAWNAAVSERISALCAVWKRSSFLTRVMSIAFVGVLVAYASNKPPENEQEGRYLCLFSSLPEGQSEEPAPDPRQGETILSREWNLPGAWEYSMRRQDFANGFIFPYGTNHLACVHVSSQGYLCESRFSTNVIASIGVPVAVVPGLTECSHEYTVSNTYLFSWTNAAVNRDTNTLVSASLELLRNGDIVITTNGFTRTVPRELPFVHDGYGQDEAWVRANFDLLQDIDGSLTNVEQILSVGYANWVDAMVGEGLTNGLYKFTASFTEVPPETTQFWIGDYSLAVTNSGEYVFVIKKGEEYGFGTWPYDETVDYWMQDDLGPDSPMVMSWWDWPEPGEWTVDGGWSDLGLPSVSCCGYCLWMPTLRGAPNVSHLTIGDFPVAFNAELLDYCGTGSPDFSWSSTDDNLLIWSPNDRTTRVSCAVMPECRGFFLCVNAYLNGMGLQSELSSTYGTNIVYSVGAETNYLLQVSFSKGAVIFENPYESGIDGVICPGRSTASSLTIHACGGPSGGRLTVSTTGDENVVLHDGSEIFLPSVIDLAPQESVDISLECQGTGDGGIFSVDCEFSLDGIAPLRQTASLEAVKIYLETVYHAPNGASDERHVYGIGEMVMLHSSPSTSELVANASDATVRGASTLRTIEWGVSMTNHVLELAIDDVVYLPEIQVKYPSGVEGVNIGVATNGLPNGAAGGIHLCQQFRILPLDVSFYGLSIEEVPCYDLIPPVGYFSYFPTNSIPLTHTRHAGAGRWASVSSRNIMQGVDRAGTPDALPKMTNDGQMTNASDASWLDGTLTWKIPFGWNQRFTAGEIDPVGTFAAGTRQTLTMTQAGALTVEKLGHTAQRFAADGRVLKDGEVVEP